MNMLTTPNQNHTVSPLSQNICNIKQDRGKRTPGDDESVIDAQWNDPLK